MKTTLNKREELVDRRQWKGKWVYSKEYGTGPYYTMFRKSFSLDEAAAAATLDVTVDRFYKLYVNGVFAGEGPVRSGAHYWTYDTYDIARYLNPGENAVCVLAAQWNPSSGRPVSLLAELRIKAGTAAEYILGTGKDWKMRGARGWRHDAPTICWLDHLWVGYVEIRDLRADDDAWLLPDFDDSLWSQVEYTVPSALYKETETGAHSGSMRCLIKRDIPYLESTIMKPKTIVNTGEVQGTEFLCA
jgi:hypothetical protein